MVDDNVKDVDTLYLVTKLAAAIFSFILSLPGEPERKFPILKIHSIEDTEQI